MTQSKDDYFIDLSGVTLDTFTTSDDTITVSMNDYMVDTIDLDGITINTTVDDSAFTINSYPYIEFDNIMPDVEKVKAMCKEYPALDTAFEKFKNVYAMVHQDWKGKQNDEELPF